MKPGMWTRALVGIGGLLSLVRAEQFTPELVADFVPGPDGSHPVVVNVDDPASYWLAHIGGNGWIYEMAAGEPRLLSAGQSEPDQSGFPAVVNAVPLGSDTIYIRRNRFQAPWRLEVWKSTPGADAQLLIGLPQCSNVVSKPNLVRWNGKVYFIAEGSWLWETDGTPGGTRRVASLRGPEDPAGECWISRGFALVADRFIFTAYRFPTTPTPTKRIWGSDGTLNGTQLLAEVVWETAIVDQDAVHEERFWFGQGSEIRSTDGTPEGTHTEFTLPGIEIPIYFQWAQGTLYFRAQVGSTAAFLFRSDGTAAGTSPYLPCVSIDYDHYEVLGQRVVTSPGNLFVSDATEQCVQVVGPHTPIQTPPVQALWRLGPRVYFVARTPENGQELWRSDGTLAGTHMVIDFAPGPDDGVSNIAVVGSDVLMSAYTQELGYELWRIRTPYHPADLNCDGVVSVGDIAPFVLAITNPAQYETQYPACDLLNADMNLNAVVNVADIGGFVAALTGR